MKKISMLILALAVLVFVPVLATAATVEGTIQGFNCVTQGKVCPVGKEDPMAAAERVFVVLTPDNTYYFVPNVDRAVLARRINDRVRITGDVNMKFNSINATKIEVFMKGVWQETWSQEEQDKLQLQYWKQ